MGNERDYAKNDDTAHRRARRRAVQARNQG
jgi:hypothetical protein